MERSDWWDWELELSPHLLKRMIDRQFNEADLRSMLEDARDPRKNHEEGRWVLEAQHQGRVWEIVVEPEMDEEALVVITAYPVE